MNAAHDLYMECCQRHGVKPNSDIEAQVMASDLLHMRLIDASHTFLGRLGVLAVLSLVRQHRCIEEVRLPQNSVDETCMSLLADIITDAHPSLRSVDVAGNLLSTPSIRRVWAAARQNTRFTHLVLEGCGVTDEWVTRLQTTLRANEDMELHGYEPYGIPRSPHSWHTVFLLTLGAREAVQEYCEKCLPAVNKYMAAARVRVAALTLSEGDSAEQVESKLARCQDAFNHQLTWCVALLGAEPFSKPQLSALAQVLCQKPPSQLPLRDKMGKLRPRVYRASRSFFCYTPMSWEVSGGVNDVVPASQWLRSAGFAGAACYESLTATVTVPAAVMTPRNRVVRWQSDLFTSLQMTFREPAVDGSTPAVVHADEVQGLEASQLFYTNADEIDMVRGFVLCGRFHPKKTALVLGYVSGPYRDSSSPFILYGAGCIGKSSILCNVASLLWEGRPSVGGEVPARVVCHVVDVDHCSVAVFLYRLLHLFAPGSTLWFTSVDALAEGVRDAIRTYAGPTVALLLGRIDLLDTCGCHCSILAAWLPHILPQAVRIVVSLDTESPVLPLLRKRMPQPFECLCPPMADINSLQLFKTYLKERNVVLPGMDMSELKSRGALGMSEKSYLQKEEALTVLYPRLASSYAHHLLNTGSDVESEYEAHLLIEGALPPTVAELVQSLHDKAVMLHPQITVETLLVLVSLAPLPASELVYICEELGSCPRHTTLSALLMLSDMGLFLWYKDATAHVAHPILKTLFLDICREHVPRLSVLLESHLYRLVITYSAEVPHAFWHLAPLMIENGNMRQAVQLLCNPLLVDAMLRRGPVHRLHVLDAFLHLLQARTLLREVASLVGPPVPQVMAEGPLMCCLREVANYSSDLYQTALLRRSFSPYASAEAATKCITPQLFLRPLNDGQENTATVSARVSEACSCCHCRGGCVVAATNESVFVFTSDLGKPIAELHMPFERQKRITGVLHAAGTRVLVASETQVLVWDYESNLNFLFADISIEARATNLDTFGSLLVATSTATNQLCLIDVLKKRIVRELPDMEEGVRQRGFFCGNRLLLLSRCCLCLYDEEMKEYVTFTHDSLVTTVSCNRDGRVLVSYAGTYLHVWTSAGELLHRIDVGPDPLVRLRMSATGAHYVTQQGTILQVWRTLAGAACSTLRSPFSVDSDIEYVTFTEDSAKVVARSGPYIIVWDPDKGSLIGAESAPVGLIQHVTVHDSNVFATTTTGDVHSWSLERGLSSIDQVKEGQRTTNILRNAKVSTQSVRSVSTNRAGTLLVTVDAAHYLRLYSLITGAPIEHTVGRVRSAVAVGPDMVVFMPQEASHLGFYYLGGKTQLDKRALPKTALPEADYALYVSPDELCVGVTVHQCHHSRTLIYEVERGETTLCQLLGHAGRIIEVSFFGSFAFTVGEKDACVRLWSLSRKAERTSYTHPCPLVAAAGNGSGMLFCVDAEGAVVRLHVDNIVSVKHAALVVTSLKLHAAVPLVQASAILQLSVYKNYLILVRATGELLLLDTLCDDVGHRVAFLDCQRVCVCTIKDAPVLLTGHGQGKVILNSLLHAGVREKSRRSSGR
ncbi:conserved hypothetical protein [Leishmania infantum JPCM5]|uniref:Uncharacterized protein n=2 Tax=Leishmania infantum TaxID=5671 RepID=A4I505_LEIIN|nr:conserved hypothetical protein [Leishmania infantum JPCM5]CAC9511480.1 hypothetical_protein_-_conserved [Leishmania infantum]CAM69873.1 conserved hypothetical protein [Leishmania infantum JPCM5]SUZ43823.1 hypothetical_protein_-_conserved [Leishmania infantum]|eukprot:XP_001466824.1 conserved hypothetical protein [Leishmania infantum JPCM5]